MNFPSILTKILARALEWLHPWLIFLSILSKTYALALVRVNPWYGAIGWTLGALIDWLVIRVAFGGGTTRKVITQLVTLHVAAVVIGWGALDACQYAAIRWKDGIPVLASLVGGGLRLTGLSVGTHGGSVVLTTMAGPLDFAMSIDRLGLQMPLLFLTFGAVWLFWAGVTLRDVLVKLGAIACLLLGVTVVCGVCQVLLPLGLFDFIGYESEELPYRPFMDERTGIWIHLPFLLMAGVLIGKFLMPPSLPDAPSDNAPSDRLPPVLRWGIIPVLLALCGIIAWEPAGTPKTGKILICSSHAQWSPPTRPYDRDWYGPDSGYNYACMKRFFGLFYHQVAETTGALTMKDLDGTSVLIIYLPDKQFSKDEIELVQGFVRNGGGLMVIGDHTNVFGSMAHINELCVPFGFQYRDDVLFDLDNDFHQMMYPPCQPAQFWNGISLFKLRGPTSIRPTSFATRCTYEVDHSKGVRAIYSVNNFYPPPHDDPKMTTGTFCVSAASHYGRGRVAAWGDSTVFSNFEIYYPGKYELLTNTANWLNHQDDAVGGALRRIMPVIVLLGLALFLGSRRKPQAWLAAVTITMACMGAARLACLLAEQRRPTFPAPTAPSQWVLFAAHKDDPGHNLCGFFSNEPYNERYEVFIQWVLRTGAYPGFWLLDDGPRNGFYQHLKSSDQTVTAHALIVRKPADLSQLDEAGAIPMRAKDPLLLMFVSTIQAPQAIERIKHAGLVQHAEALAAIAAAWPAGEVMVRDGERQVMVIAGAERFSDQAMGISEKVVPDTTQRALFTQAFGVIDRLLGRAAAGGK